MNHADKRDMRALSIRQPYAELILRGVKTIEYRSRPTRILGERFWIYASRQWAGDSGRWAVKGERSTDEGAGKRAGAWSKDLQVGLPPAWMLELAEQVKLIDPGADLPRGLLVGSAVIDRVSLCDGGTYAWHLTDVERLAKHRRPDRHPQPAWFRPF